MISRWRRVGRLLGICTLVLAMMCVPVAADDGGPTVTVDAPINASTSTTAEAEVTVSDGTLVLTGTATDPDGISHVTIARTYEYHDAGDDARPTEIDEYYATPDASNGSFAYRVPLGTGTNEVNLSVVDGAGYPTQVDIVVHVEDDEAPTADQLTATPDGRWVHLTGWVRDNVQVAEVRAGGQTIQTQTGKRDLDREDVRLDDRVPRPDAETLNVTLIDQAGNSREVTVPIGSEQTATPTPAATPTKTAQPAPPQTATPTPNTTAAGTPASTPRVATATDTPTGGGTSPLSLLGVVIVIGAALAMLSVGGGGW